MKIDEKKVIQAYEYAKEVFAQIGVDTDKAIEKMLEVPVSIHCWQGDDVGGFENPDGDLTGGIQATGNYPGKARTPDELRADLDKAISFIPGSKKLNLHASYAETNNKAVERNEIKPEHFKNWLDWANGNDMGLDFNPTLFSHPKSEDGFTLSHHDDSIRQFWVEHCIASREIGEYFGKNTNKTCVTNVWIPDGYKDTPADRLAPRQRLIESLDKVFEKEINPKYNKDAVESKLFGIGSESYVVGSHEFYMGYSMSRNKLLCLDTGHFHPTEMVSNKISAVMPFVEGILLHVSRPVRWDSDHVVAYNEEVQEIAKELVRNNYLDNTYIGLDFFDASINRVAAWVIGTRNVKKALLNAFLQPSDKLKEYELEGDFTSRLAMQEELKFYPVNAIWDYLCLREETGVRDQWLEQVKDYEKEVLLKR